MLVVLTNIPTPYRTAFFNILNNLLKNKGQGFHVIYCAKTEPRRFWNFKPEENRYEYTFLPGWHPVFKNYYPHVNFGLLKKIKQLDPKYLLVAGSWNAPATINILLNKGKIKAKVLFWSEGHQDAQRSSNKWINLIRKKIYKNFNYFVVPNMSSELYIRKFNKNALIGFLPNTIDEDFYESTTNNIDCIKEKHGLTHLKKIFVCVAALNHLKGVFDLLKAYNLLDKAIKKQIGLVFLGTGELLIDMKKYKEINNLDNVYLFGHQDKYFVKDLVSASDVFILPTRLDSNPLTPLEASFMRKPLILSKFAGNYHELLIENKNGFGLQSVDINSIYNSLKFFIEKDKDEITQMGELSYENVKLTFARVSVANSLISFLNDIDGFKK